MTRRRPRFGSPGACRRSRTTPRNSSGRRTSASSSTPPASSSRSASGSWMGRSTPATTTCSRRRPASAASSRSPPPTSPPLLAGGPRLGSFLAIAKGDVAPDHWFRLGRALTPVGRSSALISWSGSMFEYLMPALVMHATPRSLLDQTYSLVVARQKSYAAERGVPWGISESAFNARDLEQTYQYASFGVPGLGLKRRPPEDVVVAPYATALGAMIKPEAAVRNF